jgi:23S rRNA (uracil-5-)-methyltransferase RumA
VARKKAQARPSPVTGLTEGPDKKGRFWLPLPSSGKPLLFHSGIPDEMVRARRGKKGRRGEQGDLLEVLRAHPQRRQVQCAHFGVCGGCTMQQMPEALALEVKTREIYGRLAERFPQAQAHPPVASPSNFAYRTKIELSFLRESDGITKLGFHRRGRFDKLVDLERCWLSSLPASTIETVRDWAHQHGLVGWDARHGGGDLRYLLYRKSSTSAEDLVALVLQTTAGLTSRAREDLVKRLQEAGIRGALLLWQSSVAGAIVPDREEPLYGPQTWTERLGELEFELGWKSFYQVNPPAYLLLLKTLRSWRLTPTGGRILDLFCGVGSIGLFLARPGDQLSGVELVEQAVADARASALRNGIEANFEAMPAEDWEALGTDLLLLDPPRCGCHPRLLKLLQERAPSSELFYISCNPHRLFEELDALDATYQLLAYQAFDFFPQTHHVELLLHFQARPETEGH